MKRRDFIAATAAVLVSPRPLRAGGPPRRVGYLDGAFKNVPLFKVWQDSLRDHGWIEGKNLIVDYVTDSVTDGIGGPLRRFASA
jgi:putative ABC transport system substrate-binding protein